LDGLGGVFGREPSHHQCQLSVGCHPDGGTVNPLHVCSGTSAAMAHFYNKFGGFHDESYSLVVRKTGG
jgi:hypothetical protein